MICSVLPILKLAVVLLLGGCCAQADADSNISISVVALPFGTGAQPVQSQYLAFHSAIELCELLIPMNLTGKVIVVDRGGGCSHEAKARRAQAARADALIIVAPTSKLEGGTGRPLHEYLTTRKKGTPGRIAFERDNSPTHDIIIPSFTASFAHIEERYLSQGTNYSNISLLAQRKSYLWVDDTTDNLRN